MDKTSIISPLLNTLPQQGNVRWIGIRPERQKPVQVVNAVLAKAERGLEGDHFNGKPGSKRQVTLLSEEHIQAVASMLDKASIDPGLLRRNIVVKGINLLALKDKRFQIGEAVLEMTGHCHPCSRMEENLGPGGYNAMRGHGGITARIIRSGRVKVGDIIKVFEPEETSVQNQS